MPPAQLSDWTERYRPATQTHLVGNANARRRIGEWLKSWEHGRPGKRGVLLIGPPGVGKTTIARAIAKDMGWDVIELNASDARNAASLRRAATAGATHRSLFSIGNDDRHTLILIDEVDHLQGGLTKMGEQRINKMLTAEEGSADAIIGAGDKGGKAELLHLLGETRHPVILACNDEMGLWGRRGNWSEVRARFRRVVEEIHFNRVRKEDMRAVARRVLQAENLTIDPEAMDLLVRDNPGDIRALIRDMQAIASGSEGHIHVSSVRAYMNNGQRDQHHNIFAGLERLYASRDARSAKELGPHLDTSPDDLVNWVSWNNSSLMADATEVKRGAHSLAAADLALPVRFTNRAYRSWYWGGQLAILSAVCPRSQALGKVRISYPDFLRMDKETWRRQSIIHNLADSCGASLKSTQEELMPILSAMHSPEHPGNSPEDFRLSMALELSGDEHAMLCGLSPARNSTKVLIEKFDQQVKSRERPLELADEPVSLVDDESKEDAGPVSGQTTLF